MNCGFRKINMNINDVREKTLKKKNDFHEQQNRIHYRFVMILSFPCTKIENPTISPKRQKKKNNCFVLGFPFNFFLRPNNIFIGFLQAKKQNKKRVSSRNRDDRFNEIAKKKKRKPNITRINKLHNQLIKQFFFREDRSVFMVFVFVILNPSYFSKFLC